MKPSEYTEYGKKAPMLLNLLIPVTFAFAIYYYARVLMQLNDAFYYYDANKSLFVLFYTIIFFVLYINYMITLTWLYSGNRRSWARIMRLSLLYIVLTILQIVDVADIIKGDVFNIGTVVMLVVMVAMMLLMMTKTIREYFTPPYAIVAPLSNWLLYIVWIDPYRAVKVTMV